MKHGKRLVAIGVAFAVGLIGLESINPVMAGATQIELVCAGHEDPIKLDSDGNSSPVRTPFGVVIGSADRDASGTPLFTAGSRIIVCISGVAIASCSDNGGAGNAIGTLLQITNTAGTADVASAASAQPVCGILSETIAAAAGTVLRRVVVVKKF